MSAPRRWDLTRWPARSRRRTPEPASRCAISASGAPGAGERDSSMQHDHDPIRLKPDDGRWPAFDMEEVRDTPEDALHRLGDDIEAAGDVPLDPDRDGAVGATMFDSPASEDNSVTVLLA